MIVIFSTQNYCKTNILIYIIHYIQFHQFQLTIILKMETPSFLNK